MKEYPMVHFSRVLQMALLEFGILKQVDDYNLASVFAKENHVVHFLLMIFFCISGSKMAAYKNIYSKVS